MTKERGAVPLSLCGTKDTLPSQMIPYGCRSWAGMTGRGGGMRVRGVSVGQAEVGEGKAMTRKMDEFRQKKGENH